MLDPQEYPYVILTKQQLEGGDYIQCTGSKDKLTVEIRVYDLENRFRHLVLGRGGLRKSDTLVFQKFSDYTVDDSQALELEDAKRIFREFLIEHQIHGDYTSTDITERFTK